MNEKASAEAYKMNHECTIYRYWIAFRVCVSETQMKYYNNFLHNFAISYRSKINESN